MYAHKPQITRVPSGPIKRDEVTISRLGMNFYDVSDQDYVGVPDAQRICAVKPQGETS